MIVCSCNYILKHEIEEVIQSFLMEDAWTLVTPGRVYAALAKRGKCCGCFPNVINVIVSVTRNFHREQNTPEADIIPFISRIIEEHERCDTVRQLALLNRQRKHFA